MRSPRDNCISNSSGPSPRCPKRSGACLCCSMCIARRWSRFPRSSACRSAPSNRACTAPAPRSRSPCCHCSMSRGKESIMSGDLTKPSGADLERLSRFVAGDLDPAEAEALKAPLSSDQTLRRALQALERLDAASAALSDGLSDDAADALVKRAMTEVPSTTRWRPRLAFAAGFAAAAITIALIGLHAPESTAAAFEGEVWLDGEMFSPLGGPRLFGREHALRTGPKAAASVHSRHGTVLLPQNSRVENGALVGGAAFIDGRALEL